MSKFKPFKDPDKSLDDDDDRLVYAVGPSYFCTGCREEMPDGVWLYPNIEDDMVVGIVATNGVPLSDATDPRRDGRIVHSCGKTSVGDD
jgi:hypothetical protein